MRITKTLSESIENNLKKFCEWGLNDLGVQVFLGSCGFSFDAGVIHLRDYFTALNSIPGQSVIVPENEVARILEILKQIRDSMDSPAFIKHIGTLGLEEPSVPMSYLEPLKMALVFVEVKALANDRGRGA